MSSLTTLILDDCDINHIFQTNVFFPENLKTLCIWDCRLPRPVDLLNFKYLQNLQIEGWNIGLLMMPNTTSSSLPSLEKLHIPNGFKIWGKDSKCGNNDVSMSVLVEISKLTGLNSLQMFLKNTKLFQDTNIFANLLEFNIIVDQILYDSRYFLDSSVSLKRPIKLQGSHYEGLKTLIEKA